MLTLLNIICFLIICGHLRINPTWEIVPGGIDYWQGVFEKLKLNQWNFIQATFEKIGNAFGAEFFLDTRHGGAIECIIIKF